MQVRKSGIKGHSITCIKFIVDISGTNGQDCRPRRVLNKDSKRNRKQETHVSGQKTYRVKITCKHKSEG